MHSPFVLYPQLVLCFTDPTAITAIEVTEVCTNDFTVSWTAASNEEGLSYTVTLSSPSMMNDTVVDAMMDTSYNFTVLMPNTYYNVSVVSRLTSTTCVGTPTTTMVTTLTIEAGVPASELIVVNMCEEEFIILERGREYITLHTSTKHTALSYYVIVC